MSDEPMPSAKGLTGAAGEYHVAAELSRREWLATVTIKNAPGTDVLAQRRDRRRIVALQTKTASPGTRFRLSAKDEAPGERDSEWYALVQLGELTERPKFYVVPRHVIAAVTYLEHRDWLESWGRIQKPAKAGIERRENMMRSVYPEYVEGYLERWDILDDPSWDAPYLGASIFADLSREGRLPHPYRPLA